MKRRWMLAGLALVAIVAVAVPALAGDSGGKQPRLLDVSQTATASRIKAHHALGVAKKARKRADRALKLARKGGQVVPAPAASAVAFAEAAGAVTTSSTASYIALSGGPSVTVSVPQATNTPQGTGLIEVAAQARLGDDAGAVALFQDGSAMPGQSDVCATVAGLPGPALFASADGLGGTWGTPASIESITGACGSTGPAGPVMFVTTAGSHTYELRYAFCGCAAGSSATFSQRRLWVTPLS
jgi:hypothetical protein